MPTLDFGVDTRVSVAVVSPQDTAAVAQIEAFVARRSDTTPFHRPAWVDAVARGAGQQSAYIVARGPDGAIRGFLPLNIIHSPLFGRALVSSGFAVDGGIVADEPATARLIAEAAVALAARHSCPTVELRGGAAPGPKWTVRSGAYLNFARPLEQDAEAQLLSIPKKHRAEVRKGLTNGFGIEIGTGDRLRDIHYALYRRSVHNLGTPVFPRALFEEVLDAFGDQANILLVKDGDTPLSAVISLYHRGACMPYWHGADLNARKARSNEVLYFNLMLHAMERGCDIFDFGRSKVGTGPALWKKTWGFEADPLDYFVHAAAGHEARDVNPLSPQYRRKVELWKRLPAPIADRIGPWIARGLG
ncbi:FemAB family PEP-CTERM system-associated protein [Sphingobium sufflavum]|uniref:FemAB family XrtA/PEP-CTERM system-associated protein n=1 Tax=Sphingobium sufflavum TaxID=1129547 RepID=UPI001F421AB0|nr:FemAB family XrtA/PEP-CTERM system-associated protein [Sphingobium sufflavum]MCE7797381.1 FemAB family PEP-CTERM system-associated protein [Sphingobium sufflavum]